MGSFPDTRASLILKISDTQNAQAWDEFTRIYRPVVYRLVRQRGFQDLATREVLRIGMQAAAGLAAAHAQGLIHRDVKPANILLEKGVERALLTDFGLARAADDASLTHSGIVAGTPHYMSPEQARGEPATARSDLFSLGSVLYFMATGHPPFRAEQAMGVLHRICQDRHRPVSEANTSVSDELEDLIDRLLEKQPSKRCASANEVQQKLATLLVDIEQPRRRRPIRQLLRARSRRLQLTLAGITLFTMLFAIGGSGWFAKWMTSTKTEGESTAAKTTELAPTEVSPTVNSNSNSNSQILVTTYQTQQAELTSELTDIQASLNWVLRNPYPETILLRHVQQSWLREIHSVNAEVARFENSW